MNILTNYQKTNGIEYLMDYFKSIHELCSHIYICDFNWLKRFKSLRLFKTLSNTLFDTIYSFTEIIFEDRNEYSTKRRELDNIIIEYIDELNKNDIESILRFTDSKGNKMERKMESLHMFNHETHHRGMISLYLELMDIENGFSGSLYKMES